MLFIIIFIKKLTLQKSHKLNCRVKNKNHRSNKEINELT